MKQIIILAIFLLPIHVNAQWNLSETNTFNQPLENNVGIGTSSPKAVLEIYKASLPHIKVSSPTTSLEIGIATCDGCFNPFANTSSAVIRPLGSSGPIKNILFSTATTANSGSYFTFASDSDILMKINDNKTISMGDVSTPTGYFLYVEKGILTEKLKIAVKSDAVNWSDFVFDKDYKLLPLAEVESYIKNNKHLPEIPSAKEIYKEGLDVALMDAKLLQKIEEFTLYLIELKKENELLRSRISNLEKLASK